MKKKVLYEFEVDGMYRVFCDKDANFTSKDFPDVADHMKWSFENFFMPPAHPTPIHALLEWAERNDEFKIRWIKKPRRPWYKEDPNVIY